MTKINPDIRFLIVDDFETIRKIVRQILTQMGITSIVQAESGKEAWALLNKLKGADAPQFIISDWDMPEMNGLELLKLCKADPEFSKIPFIILSSEGGQKLIQEFIANNVDGYVKKPVCRAPLEGEILTVLSKRPRA